jgi:hypothetical protein
MVAQFRTSSCYSLPGLPLISCCYAALAWEALEDVNLSGLPWSAPMQMQLLLRHLGVQPVSSSQILCHCT